VWLKRSRRAVVLAALVSLAVGIVRGARAPAAVDCSGAPGKSRVVVDSARRSAALCEGERRVDAFTVRLGYRGLDKRAEGDGRTPSGIYVLEAPRPSAAFGTFIPVDFPTEAQRRAGYSGSAIGVHGPNRRVRWAGRWVNAFDTTDGCIGIATDAEMDRLAAWVQRAHAAEIVIR
jgi:L,D-peptidoglycan transpeptidase YkuD (ErfK/YbiS/YcfS/YnhG family)